jgi:hypothetical protein
VSGIAGSFGFRVGKGKSKSDKNKNWRQQNSVGIFHALGLLEDLVHSNERKARWIFNGLVDSASGGELALSG